MESPESNMRRHYWTVLGLLLGLFSSVCTYDFGVLREEHCQDGLDDDGDGLTDCDDPDCFATLQCTRESECENGLDDDGDGLADCEDPDCGLTPLCLGPRPCTNDDVCDTFESCFWCEDCCPKCSLLEGSKAEYIATELAVPSSAAEGGTIGVDMNNDGQIDNALGGILGILGEDQAGAANQSINEDLQNGEFILLARMMVDAFPTDLGVAFQVFPGLADPTMDATEDNLGGQGHALIDMEADRSAHLCGALVDGTLTTGPRPFVLPIGMLGGIVYLPLERAQAYSPGIITADEIPELHLGGGLTKQTVNNQLLPFMAVRLNDRIRTEPTSSFSQSLLGYVDSNCNSSIEGCSDVQNGVGECTRWDGQPSTLPLSVTELRCNLFLNTALQPDVDIDGDNIKDLISVGMKIRAIHVTIDN